MKHAVMLPIASLLSILLLTLHVTDDIVRGISKAEPSNIALLTLTVFLYGTLVLGERRSGHIIMLLVGLFAAAMPVINMRGAHLRRDRQVPRRLLLRLDTLGAWRARGLHPHPRGARTVEPTLATAAVVKKPEMPAASDTITVASFTVMRDETCSVRIAPG
jgi:hypothetical protein